MRMVDPESLAGVLQVGESPKITRLFALDPGRSMVLSILKLEVPLRTQINNRRKILPEDSTRPVGITEPKGRE